MDITENVLRVSDRNSDGDIIGMYHYDCYIQQKKLNAERKARKRLQGYQHSFYNPTVKVSYT